MKTPKMIYSFIADLVLRTEDVPEVLKKAVSISRSKIIETYYESNDILTNIFTLIESSANDDEKKRYTEILYSRFEVQNFLNNPISLRGSVNFRNETDIQIDIIKNACQEIENEEYAFSWFSSNLRNRNFYIREIYSLKKAYRDRLFDFRMSFLLAPIICGLIFTFFFIVDSWYAVFPILALLWEMRSYFTGRRKKRLSVYHIRIFKEEALNIIPLHYDTMIGQEQMKILMGIITDNIKRQSEKCSKPMRNKINNIVEDLLCTPSYSSADLKLCFDILKVGTDLTGEI